MLLDESAADLPTPADFDTLDAVPAWQWCLLDIESDARAVRNVPGAHMTGLVSNLVRVR